MAVVVGLYGGLVLGRSREREREMGRCRERERWREMERCREKERE